MYILFCKFVCNLSLYGMKYFIFTIQEYLPIRYLHFVMVSLPYTLPFLGSNFKRFCFVFFIGLPLAIPKRWARTQ